MKKFLLSMLVGATALSAGAASRQLLSVTEESWGDKYVTTYEYDAEGRLTKIVDGNEVITFDYSMLASKKLVMKSTDPWDTYVYEMLLDDNGLVVKAQEFDNGQPDDDYMTFEYTDGYLTNFKMIRPDEVEETRIAYTDGRITKVEELELDNPSECETKTYEYNGIMNPGGLVVFDCVFNIDLDEMEYVAMTGHLGKIYTELPVKLTESDIYGSESTSFAWTVDDQGYATQLSITDEWDTYTYTYQWSGTTGINSVSVDNLAAPQYFTIDGKPASSHAKGIVIERRADGTTVKRVIR